MNDRIFVALSLLLCASDTARAKGEGLALLDRLVLPWAVKSVTACRDPAGKLHVAGVQEGRVVHASARARGSDFGQPMVIDEDPAAPAVGKHSGLQLRAAPGGDLWAAWQSKAGLQVFRSRPPHESWQRVPVDLGKAVDLDVMAIGVGPDGTVALVWSHTGDPKEPDDSVAAHLYLALAPDGASFGPARRITEDGYRACPCCQPAIAMVEAGRMAVLYRSSRANIKESAVLLSKNGGRTFEHRQLSRHAWKFMGCPAVGPAIAWKDKDLVGVWANDKDIYCSWSRDGAETFGTPVHLGTGRFVAAAVGDVPFITWEMGPQTGIWPASSPEPRPEVAFPPAGALVSSATSGFVLIQSR